MQPHLMINSQGCFQRGRVRLLLILLGRTDLVLASSSHGWGGVLTGGDTVQNEHGQRPTWMWGPGILEEDAIQFFVPSPWQSSQVHLKIKCQPGLSLTFTANMDSWAISLIK